MTTDQVRAALQASIGKHVLIDVDDNGTGPWAEVYTAVAVPVTLTEKSLHFAYSMNHKEGAFLEKVALRHVKLVRPFPTKKEA